MDKYPVVVPTSQGSPNTPHERGTGTNLNPEGLYLKAAPSGGRGNPNTSTTRKDCGRTPIRVVYFSGSAETKNGTDRRTIRDEGRTLEGMAKGGDQGKRPRHRTLGKTGDCDEVSVQRRRHTDIIGTDNDGAHP